MKPQVYHVDAFTSQPFRGNSAGVVFPADNLSEAQMQLIARELGHSETAFLLHSDDSDVRIRYFTPTVEVPICGHATVAAHYVRAKVLGLGNCTIWQTSLAGKHRVTIEKHNDDYRISLEQGTPGFELPLEGEVRAAIINALHLTEDDILPGLPIQVATTGHSKVMIPLKPEVDIDALSPDLSALTAISYWLQWFLPVPDPSRQKRNRWSHVLACDWYCGRSGDWQCQWPDGCMVGTSQRIAPRWQRVAC